MDEHDSNDKQADKAENKIIHFPALEERLRLKKSQAQIAEKATKEAHKQAEKLRAQYRALQARQHSTQARRSAGGSEPFFNFGEIPFFTNLMIWVLLTIHLWAFMLFDSGEKYAFFVQWGFLPDAFTDGEAITLKVLATTITSLFIHASWMHIINNVLMLLVMGLFFEREYGIRKTILFYFACGVAGNLAYLLISPNSTVPVIGASGAINGLFAASFMLMYSRGLMGPITQNRGPLPFILLWICLIAITGMISRDISWQSHLGGFMCGLGMYMAMTKTKIKLNLKGKM
jgi:membrane associated rhomboid family serine protease